MPRQFDEDDRRLPEELAHLAEQELAATQLATTDEPTQLSMCARLGKPTTLLFFGLDAFKPINDQFGHGEGDRALASFAALLMRNFRDSDVVAGFCGDEFVVRLTGSAAADGGAALLQTLAAGIGLFIAKVPFAGLLTAVILILCIAPLGPGLVLIPVVVWLYWSGATGWGTFLLVWSVPVIMMDSVVRPVLIRRGADLPLLLIFAGVIGGLLSMGIVGLFIGPVALGVTWRLFETWAGFPERPAADGPPNDKRRPD